MHIRFGVGEWTRAALRQCVDILRQGNILLLFPEGTRSRDGELQPPKNGAAMIATMADVPIVPTYVEGTFEAWPIGRRLPRLKKIRVFYGEPFLPPRTTVGERPDYDALSQDIISRIVSLQLKQQPINKNEKGEKVALPDLFPRCDHPITLPALGSVHEVEITSPSWARPRCELIRA